MRRIATLAMVVALLMVAASPAMAAKPTVDFDMDYDDTCPLIDCGDFVVMNREVGHHRQLLWGDPMVPDRALHQAAGTDHLYRAGAPDVVLSGNHHMTARLTFDWSVFPPVAIKSVSGLVWNIRLPGEGHIYKKSGLIVSLPPAPGVSGPIIKRAGLTNEDEAAVCAAFAD
jgi:hypothetical protein